jgi:hypothetical protein
MCSTFQKYFDVQRLTLSKQKIQYQRLNIVSNNFLQKKTSLKKFRGDFQTEK